MTHGSTNLERYGSVTVTCLQCGQAFHSPPSRIRNGRARYCSRACSSAMKREAYKGRNLSPGQRRTGADNPNWRGRRVARACPVCGDVFASPQKTCSVRCGHILQAEAVSKEGNGNWRDEGTWLLRNYATLVRKAKCARCGRTKRLLVHHVDGDRTHNVPDNLVVLCPSCHQRAHHALRSP